MLILDFDFNLKIEKTKNKLAAYVGFDFRCYCFSNKFYLLKDNMGNKVVCAKFLEIKRDKNVLFFPQTWVPHIVIPNWPNEREIINEVKCNWKKQNLKNFAKKINRDIDTIDNKYQEGREINELVYSLRLYTNKIFGETIKLILNSNSWITQVLAIQEFGLRAMKLMRNIKFGFMAEDFDNGVFVFKLNNELRSCCLLDGMQIGYQTFKFDDILEWVIIYK